MTTQELIDLLHILIKQSQESQWLEFKSNGIDHERIGQYISALSNGATLANQTYGYLVWGVEDGTHIAKGTSFSFVNAKHGGNQDLELWLRTQLYPKINFEIFEFVDENKHFVLLRIPAAKGEPVNFQKKPYVRVNSHVTDLRNYPDWLRTIYNSQEDWSAKIIEKATLSDLDPHALQTARVKFKEKSVNAPYYNEIDAWEALTLLDKAKVTINGKITNTAIILLGKEESVHYLLPSVAEITWKLDSEEKAYEHFGTPMLLNTTKVMQRIRNIQYKFFPDNELLATTVNKYDTRSILEALHNCIAHQDYSLNSRIIVTEKTGDLTFANAGSFFEGHPADYVMGEKTPEKYRNRWLTQAMVNLGMIDSLGYGIYSLCLSQRQRFFPMPDYDLSQHDKVILQIYGQAMDENYSKILIQRGDLTLSRVMLLDRVQKHLEIPDHAAALLKKEKLIEGRKPNYFVGLKIAQTTGQKAAYSKNKALNKQYYLDFIMESIKQHGSLTRKDIDELLWEKLPDILNDEQKKNKIGNLITELRQKGKIANVGVAANSKWVLLREI
jgi:ATP-dependent DNA helicase RecG